MLSMAMSIGYDGNARTRQGAGKTQIPSQPDAHGVP